VRKVYFWIVEKRQLSQQELRILSRISERAVRYALEFLKSQNLIMEVISFQDIRKKRYKLK
jgi:hypothetical protein